MDVKLSLDGGFSLVDGDLETVTDVEEIIANINKLMRGWLERYSVLKYAGMRNTKESAAYIKKDIELQLSKYYKNLAVRIVPVDLSAIAIFIGIPNSKVTLYRLIFNYLDGNIINVEYVDNYKYREPTNPYL